MQSSGTTQKIKTFIIESRRVLAVTRKPTRTEFTTIVKVTGVGIIIIGLIGYILQVSRNILL